MDQLLHLFFLNQAPMLGAPGLPVLENWDTTSLEAFCLCFFPKIIHVTKGAGEVSIDP